MSRKLKQLIIGFLAAFAVFVSIPAGGMMTAYAATARIAFSDPNVTVGQEFSVNVKISTQDGNLGASDVMLSYDPSSIEFVSGNNASGGAGSIRLIGTMDSSNTTQFSHTLKFKALQAGSSTISVGNYEIYDVDTQAVSVTKVGSSAVTVNAPATYSSEARLNSLKVSPGQLSPAFSSEVTSYTVNVGGDVNKLAVSAGAKDSKAKVLVSGDSGLQVGANTVVCKVTAEDGKTTKTYTITVNKSEAAEEPSEAESVPEETSGAVLGDQTAEVDGVQYTVAASFDPASLPEGYTQSSITYGGAEVMCGTGNGMTLLYLQAADGSGSFFIYVPETGALSPYVTIDVAAKSILVLPPDESVVLPEGFAATTIQLNGNYKVQGWVWQSDEEQQYCVVYGMNENGEKNLYRYDITERTFQRYFKDPALESKYDDAKVDELIDQYNSLCEDYNFRFIIIVVLIVVCLILFFIVINLLLRRKDAAEEKEMSREAGSAQRSAVSGQRQAAERSGNRKASAGKIPSGRASAERGTASERRIPADRTGAEERKAAYERAVAAERKASAEQAAVSSQEAVYERKSHVDQKRVSERAEALEKKMASGHPASEGKRTAERQASGRQATGRQAAGKPAAGKQAAGKTAAERQNAGGKQPAAKKPLKKPAERNEAVRDKNHDPGMEEIIRRRELERAERARLARERLERERLEDERRAREAAAKESAAALDRSLNEEDDFEFIEI